MKRGNKTNNTNYFIYFFIAIALLAIFVSIFNSSKLEISIKPKECNYDGDCKKCGYCHSTIHNVHLDEPPNYPSKNQDILHNSYSEPLRDDRIYNYNNFPSSFKIPINIRTQSQPDTNYRQIGILTRVSDSNNADKETVLPLMGRPLMTNRDKWNFYTMNDKNNMIKLPIVHKNKRATSEQGVDNLYEGDVVDVVGYSDKFKVTVYDNNVMRYIPYL